MTHQTVKIVLILLLSFMVLLGALMYLVGENKDVREAEKRRRLACNQRKEAT